MSYDYNYSDLFSPKSYSSGAQPKYQTLTVYKGFNPKSKVLRIISKAPFYVSNDTLHYDFNLPTDTK